MFFFDFFDFFDFSSKNPKSSRFLNQNGPKGFTEDFRKEEFRENVRNFCFANDNLKV